MRLIAFVLIALLTLAAPVRAAEPGRYDALVERLKAGDVDIDYGALRDAYTQTAAYNPYVGPADALISTMYGAYNARRFDEAVALAEQVLAKEYVSIDAHAICDLAYRELKDPRADGHRAIGLGLLQSVRGAGDGASPQTAYSVIAIREEYSYLRLNGLKTVRQRLVNENSHVYDAMEVTDRNGESRTIYFNVDRPFAWMAAHFNK